ncbi:MAG: HEPN domain-containing protein [Bacteroidota bacterium]
MNNSIVIRPSIAENKAKSEHQLNNFFANYPIEFIEGTIHSLFETILPYPLDNITHHSISYMHLFYEEFNHMIKNCAILYKLNNEEASLQNNRNLKSLNAIVSFLKEVIPAGYIFCSTTNAIRTDLVIVMDKYRYKPFDEIHTLLNFAVLGHPNINCTVHAYGTMHDTLSRGHIYYSALCIPANCVYQSESEFTLPLLKSQQCAEIINKSTLLFQQNLHKAINFYTGARQFLQLTETSMSAFMLQQACELTYRSLIVSLRGREVKCHDLVVLRKHLSHFVPEVMGLFDKEETKELNMLTSIQEAYIKSRYDSTYQVCTQELVKLLDVTEGFIKSAEQIFTRQSLKVKSALNLKVS